MDLSKLSTADLEALAAGDMSKVSTEALMQLSGQPSSKVKAVSELPKYDPTEGMSGFDKFAAGVGKSIYDTGRGIGQLFGKVSQAEIDEAAKRDAPLMNTGAGLVGNIGGQVLQTAVPVGGAIRTASTLGKLGKSAAGAAAFAGTQPVLSGETRTGNMALSGVAGAAGQGAASGLKAIAQPAQAALSPAVQSLAARAQQMGIPINAAQLSDSKFVKTLASTLERLPFTGASASRSGQQESFNRAVSRTFGEDVPNVTQDVYATAKQRIGSEFERLSGQNSLQVDNALMTQLSSLQDEAARFGSNDSARAVSNAIDEFLSKADNAGTVPGKAYQSLDSKLGKLMKSGDEKAMYLGQVRDAVRNAMDNSISGADREAWQLARSQYKALKTIRDLVAKDGADGNISPALLAGRMNASQAGKESMAMGGGGELGDLARIGQQFLKDKVPDSGTAGRLTALGMLGGLGGGVAGGSALGFDPTDTLLTLGGAATGGRALNALLNSQAGRQYMLQGSKTLRGLSQGLRPLPYAAGPLALEFQR